jgi:hypothetical protein
MTQKIELSKFLSQAQGHNQICNFMLTRENTWTHYFHEI